MPEYKLCLCSRRVLDTQSADYLVPLHGEPRPICFARCYFNYVESQHLAADLARREQVARFADAVPNHIHSKGMFDAA